MCSTMLAEGTQSKFPYLCNTPRTAGGMKLIFCLETIVPLDSTTLGVPNQVCSKCPKGHECNIFAISSGKCQS